jgi:MoxR-like ATPase
MTPQKLQIGSKNVFASQPYIVPRITDLVGRTEELELITAAWLAGTGQMPLAPLLLGEPGVGKNRVVYEVARRAGKELYIFQGHEDVTAEDLACAVRFSDDLERKMDYVASPLVTAMIRGGICFIDEIAKIRPRALALLVSVLDERRYIDSTLLGERVQAHEGFRFIAATNTADLEGNAMPEFLRSRMRPLIPVGYPAREEIDSIVRSLHPRLGAQAGSLLDIFWLEWERSGSKSPPSPRDAIYAFNLAISLADFESIGGWEQLSGHAEPFRVPAGAVQDGMQPRHLQRAMSELFAAVRKGAE